MVNITTPLEPNSAFKTAKMDDPAISEAEKLPPDSSEPGTNVTSSFEFGLPSKESKEEDEGRTQTVVMRVESWSSDAADKDNVPFSGEQYTPLVQLMAPLPNGQPPQPPQPPPPSTKPRKGPDGAKGCYTKLAENVAFELAAVNEQLNETLRTSFEKQWSENRRGQGMDEGEDTYVFVNQQGKIIS